MNNKTGWWEKCSAVTRIYCKASGTNLRDVTGQLDSLKASGIDAIEIFAPYHVMNYLNEPANVSVKLDESWTLKEIFSGLTIKCEGALNIKLPAYGYAIYSISN